MSAQVFRWENETGLEVFGQYWAPENDPKAVIALVHGMGEHSSRYEEWAKRFNSENISVIAFDHVGHGNSEGKRGHVDSYQTLIKSVDELLDRTREYFSGVPIFLYGHSMGGAVVLNYAIQNPKSDLKGLIVSSPWLKLAFEPPALQVKMGQLVKNILPAFTQSTKLDVNAISRDPEEVKAYDADKKVHDRISTMFFTEAHQAGQDAIDNADKIQHPLLIFHGTSDKITSYKASEALTKKVLSPCTFKLFEGAYHEIHNDLDRDELFQMINEWIAQRLG